MGEGVGHNPDSDSAREVLREAAQLAILTKIAIARRLVAETGGRATQQHERAVILGLTAYLLEDSQSPRFGPALQIAFRQLVETNPVDAVLVYKTFKEAQHLSAVDARGIFGLPARGRILPTSSTK
jgi:hypothetical protein